MQSNEVSLKEYFDKMREADKEALLIALTAAQRATDLALSAQKSVNKTQNEFRGTLKDQADTLMPRAEVEAVLNRMNDDIKSLQLSRASLQGKASAFSVNVAYILTGIGILLSIFSLIK